jgi:hypothetical protein
MAGRGNLAIVVSPTESLLEELAARLIARGVPSEQMLRAGTDPRPDLDAVRKGTVSCLLLNLGSDGPPYDLPLERYSGEVTVLALDPEQISAAAAESLRRCVTAPSPVPEEPAVVPAASPDRTRSGWRTKDSVWVSAGRRAAPGAMKPSS